MGQPLYSAPIASQESSTTEIVALGDGADGVERHRLAKDIDRDDRPRALRDRRLDGRRVDVKRDGVDVGKDWRRP